MKLSPVLSTLKIKTKQRGIVPLQINWAQQQLIDTVEKQYNSGQPIRTIILKARQMGISTAVEGMMFVASFMFDNNSGLVIADEAKNSTHLLNMTGLYWDTCSWKPLYSTKYRSRNEFHWNETRSSMEIATAKNIQSGRSRTIHWMHGSEVAFWPEPETLMTGLRQAIPTIPGSAIFLESTGNGIGNYFQTEWEAAENGDTEYVPLFFPWWKHPEYTAESIQIPSLLGSLSDDERHLQRVLRRLGLTPIETDSRLAWRRWAIKNLCQNDLLTFHQEYPSSPEEAFISTGRNVFPADHLKACYSPMEGTNGVLVTDAGRPRFVPSDDGNLVIYRYPSADRDYGRYFVSGDPTRTTSGDYACAQVINRRTMEQVARLRRRVDPHTFATDLYNLGRYYNDALLSTETNGPGYSTVGALLTMNYPFMWRNHFMDKAPGSVADQFGFQSNVQRKHAMVGTLLKHIVDHTITIHDRVTYGELRNYVTMDNGEMGPADPKNGFDDTVTSLGIGVFGTYVEPPLPPYGADTSVELDWRKWGREGTVQDSFNELIPR